MPKTPEQIQQEGASHFGKCHGFYALSTVYFYTGQTGSGFFGLDVQDWRNPTLEEYLELDASLKSFPPDPEGATAEWHELYG